MVFKVKWLEDALLIVRELCRTNRGGKNEVPLKPAIRNNENTESTVPDPVNQIPERLFLNTVIPMPNKTPATPARKNIRTTGIWMKLCMYLNFSTVIELVKGSAANPFEKRREITKNRKKIRKGIELVINPFSDLLIKASSSRVLIIYNKPLILARNNTAKPSARFRKFSKASRPYHCVAQCT